MRVRRALPWLIWLTAIGIAAVFLVCMAATQADARSRGEQFRCEHPSIVDDYDWAFSAAVNRHFPVFLRNEQGACLLKAQCHVESRLRPDAVSPAGAIGVCQVLESTADDLRQRGKWRGKLRDAKDNIGAGAAAWRTFWEVWITPRTMECRLELTWASFNAGPGSVIRAQREAHGALCWSAIQFGLPAVTGPNHSKETIQYVHRIRAAHRKLRGWAFD